MMGLSVEFSTGVKARTSIRNYSYNARPYLCPVVLTKQNRIEGYCILGCDAVHRGCRTTYCLHLQGSLAWLILCLWRWALYVLPKLRWTTRLYDITTINFMDISIALFLFKIPFRGLYWDRDELHRLGLSRLSAEDGGRVQPRNVKKLCMWIMSKEPIIVVIHRRHKFEVLSAGRYHSTHCIYLWANLKSNETHFEEYYHLGYIAVSEEHIASIFRVE
jgi:hypothetical protein